MRALIVFESMYGNTRVIAEGIARGLGPSFEASVVSVAEASADRVDGADLVVVGGPTHVHGLSSPRSRKAAQDAAEKPGSGLAMEPDAQHGGLRAWLEELPRGRGRAAAFDTRLDAPAVLTGRASVAIAKRLRRHGYRLVLPPESFLVDKQSHLLAGEVDRAAAWGAALAREAPLHAPAR